MACRHMLHALYTSTLHLHYPHLGFLTVFLPAEWFAGLHVLYYFEMFRAYVAFP